jgi:putative transcriptional regulator
MVANASAEAPAPLDDTVQRVNITPPRRVPRRSVRRPLGMSQARFAAATRIPLRTLQNWERRRAPPGGPALSPPRILARAPEAALKPLAE